MELNEAFLKRESCRGYQDTPVERDKLARVLGAARLAPSASNGQPWRFTVVTNPDLLRQLSDACQGLGINAWMYQAPCIIAVWEQIEERVVKRYGDRYLNGQWSAIDTGLTVSHLCLQAAQEGLGTCIVGWFDQDALKSLLGIPDSAKLRLLIPIGYPKSDAPPRTKVRKPIEEMVTFLE